MEIAAAVLLGAFILGAANLINSGLADIASAIRGESEEDEE